MGKSSEICFLPLEPKKTIFFATIIKFTHPHVFTGLNDSSFLYVLQ